MKRWMWILAVVTTCAVAYGQSGNLTPQAAYCMYGTTWIPAAASIGTAASESYPQIALYGANGTKWYPLACDANGNLIASGAIGSNTQVAFNNNGTESGDPNFTWNTSQEFLSLGGISSLGSGNLLGMGQNINGIVQTNIQNTNGGNCAQGGYSATQDTGTNFLGFMWVGINNSGFNCPSAFNIGVANDTSVLSTAGNLYLANGVANEAIYVAVGGTQPDNVMASYTNVSNAPTYTLENLLPIIGATLTLTTATQQTTQSFAVNGQALTFTGTYGSSGTVTIAGTFAACATSACVGWAMTISGAANASNNGTFILTASTASLLTFTNWYGVSETLPAGATVTSSANTTSYAGTITGGGATAGLPSGAYTGIPAVTVAAFSTHTVYNGTTFPVIASTTGYIAVTNAAAAGTAADSSGGTIRSTAPVNSPLLILAGTYGSGAGTQATDKWTVQVVDGTPGTNPTSTYTLTHAGSSGAAAVSILYPVTTAGLVAGGATFTVTSGCTTSATSGGILAGSFTASSSTCSPVITTGVTAPHGYYCGITDLTTGAGTIRETAYSQTTVTFTGASLGSTDQFLFGCVEF
jgi:hypothetical protein